MAALRAAVFPAIREKPEGRAFFAPPPSSARVNPAFAGGGGVKRPHFFRRVITPVWRGAAAPNFG